MLSKVLRRTPPLLLVVSALFFLSAYFTARFPDVPGASVGSFVATFLIATPPIVALFRWLGAPRALFALIALSAFAYAIETIGVVTGLPYGAFSYGDSLGPKFLGLVPYLLPVSYLPLVLGAVGASGGGSLASRAVKSAVLLVVMDAVLDPGAVRLGFWSYAEGGSYYGVPLSNYFGWLVSGALAAVVLILTGRPSDLPPPGLLDGALVAVAFWVGVAVFTGLVLPTLFGALLFVFLLLRRADLAATKARDPRREAV